MQRCSLQKIINRHKKTIKVFTSNIRETRVASWTMMNKDEHKKKLYESKSLNWESNPGPYAY